MKNKYNFLSNFKLLINERILAYLIVICLFALTPCWPIHAAGVVSKNSDFLIVPGKSIGNVKLHATPDHLTTMLGKPITGDLSSGRLTYWWKIPSNQTDTKSHLDVLFHQDTAGKHSFAVQIRIHSKQISTTAGITVGKSLKQIRDIFPNIRRIDSDSKLIIYDSVSKGIAFEFNNKKQCTAIIVHAAHIRVIPMDYLKIK